MLSFGETKSGNVLLKPIITITVYFASEIEAAVFKGLKGKNYPLDILFPPAYSVTCSMGRPIRRLHAQWAECRGLTAGGKAVLFDVKPDIIEFY